MAWLRRTRRMLKRAGWFGPCPSRRHASYLRVGVGRIPAVMVVSSVLAGCLAGCAYLQEPLGGVVPLHCVLPSPPRHAVAEELVCAWARDYPIPDEYRQYIHKPSNPSAAPLDLRMIQLVGVTSPAPLPVAETLRQQLLPPDIAAQLQRIPLDEYRREYWHSDQKVRYQSVIDDIPMPNSYAEFAVWKPVKTKDVVVADAEARLYRVVSKAKPVTLLDARTAFERSRVWQNIPSREPVTRVYLRYLPTVQQRVNSPPPLETVFRPVWCFRGRDRLIGDVISGQFFRIDAVTGAEFHPTLSQ